MEVYGHGRMKFSIQILIFTLYKPSVKIPILKYYRVFPLIGNFLFVSRIRKYRRKNCPIIFVKKVKTFFPIRRYTLYYKACREKNISLTLLAQ